MLALKQQEFDYAPGDNLFIQQQVRLWSFGVRCSLIFWTQFPFRFHIQNDCIVDLYALEVAGAGGGGGH